eukprot:TRINITY_DN1507_c0_g1_i4.p2 TRINITY_DN1507_c0_g1~~TRINITY_DN1507_c0_g1_i4.p2  ORF type:complete len:457 (+),score=148.63 TRINITY_DN1507_c0_g1_i4:74-1372(+)
MQGDPESPGCDRCPPPAAALLAAAGAAAAVAWPIRRELARQGPPPSECEKRRYRERIAEVLRDATDLGRDALLVIAGCVAGHRSLIHRRRWTQWCARGPSCKMFKRSQHIHGLDCYFAHYLPLRTVHMSTEQYSRLIAAAAERSAWLGKGICTLAAAVAATVAGSYPTCDQSSKQIGFEETRIERATLEHEVADLLATVKAWKDRAASAKEQSALLEQQLRARTAERDEARRAAETERAAAAQLASERDEAARAAEARREELNQLAQLRCEADQQAEAELVAARQQIACLQHQSASMGLQMQTAQQDIAALRHELHTAQQGAAAQGYHLQTAQQEAAALRSELQATQQGAADLRCELQVTQQQAAVLRGELQTAQGQAAASQHELQVARGQLAEQEQLARFAVERAAEAREKAQTLERQLSASGAGRVSPPP